MVELVYFVCRCGWGCNALFWLGLALAHIIALLYITFFFIIYSINSLTFKNIYISKKKKPNKLNTKRVGLIQNENEVHLQVKNICQWPSLHVWDSQQLRRGLSEVCNLVLRRTLLNLYMIFRR